MKNLITSLFLAVIALTSLAQEKIHQINEISVINYGDGKLESEKSYTMSVEDGVERKYDYESGNIIADKNYKEGLLHGSQTIHYTSNIGNFIEHSNYDQGKLVGKFSETFTNETIKKAGQYYNDGKKDGKWIERNNFSEKDNNKFTGKLTTYKNGEIIKEELIKNFAKFQNKL